MAAMGSGPRTTVVLQPTLHTAHPAGTDKVAKPSMGLAVAVK